MSRDYLYGNQASALETLLALKRFVAESYVHSGAYLPGGQTQMAVPDLFAAPPLSAAGPSDHAKGAEAEDPVAPRPGWPDRAAGLGLDVRVFGWHLDYCTGIALAATGCLDVSLYDRTTLDPASSPGTRGGLT